MFLLPEELICRVIKGFKRRTRCVDLGSMHGGDLSDEAELHFWGHCHGETLGVQKVGF